jgi:hypothetical protein
MVLIQQVNGKNCGITEGNCVLSCIELQYVNSNKIQRSSSWGKIFPQNITATDLILEVKYNEKFHVREAFRD